MVRGTVRCRLSGCGLARRVRRKPQLSPVAGLPLRRRARPPARAPTPVGDGLSPWPMPQSSGFRGHPNSGAVITVYFAHFRDFWCQLFSEPDAGSDLASLRLSANRQGGHWVLNGHKGVGRPVCPLSLDLWASSGPHGRSTSRSKRHCTAFVVDMHAPGIEVRLSSPGV